MIFNKDSIKLKFGLRKYSFGLAGTVFGASLLLSAITADTVQVSAEESQPTTTIGDNNHGYAGGQPTGIYVREPDTYQPIVNNVYDLGGGVNITPLETEVITDANNEHFVRAKFEISVAGVTTSDDSVSAKYYDIVTPGYAKDINIAIVGAYSDGYLLDKNDEFNPEDIDVVNNGIETKEDAERIRFVERKTAVTFETPIQIDPLITDGSYLPGTVTEFNTDSKYGINPEFDAEALLAYREAGNNTLPAIGGEIEIGNMEVDVRRYEVHIPATDIIGLNVSYDIPLEKANSVSIEN